MSRTRPADQAPPGLRERKKTRTRFAIQQAALDLFRSHGYAATTVDQIAEAADVSPSTFFRYFPTKDSLVLSDDYDPIMLESLRAQPPELGVVAAFRAAFRETFEDMPQEQVDAAEERNALILSVPELRAGVAEFLVSAMRDVLEVAAARSGRSVDDADVVAVTGAIMGVVLSSLLLSGMPVREKLAVLDTQLAQLEHGFTL